MAMRFSVESWEPVYGTPAADGVRGDANDPTTRPVDPAVEVDPDDWSPVPPAVIGGTNNADPSVVFVDGVRRIDARIWIDEPLGADSAVSARPGVCASVAAGLVRCGPSRAEVGGVVVRRGLYTASEHGESLDLAAITGRRGLGCYELRSVADDGDDAMYFGVHRHMTELELDVSTGGGMGSSGDTLVVFDGPLNDRATEVSGDGPPAVGYVKTQHVQYLPPRLHGLIGSLPVGCRTPMFTIGGRFAVWSWYLRLPTTISHAMSGIVRLELSAVVGVEREHRDRALVTADAVSRLLPRFASEAHKDGRAPQNLYPIAGLERHLRHVMGDPQVLERALRGATAPSSMSATSSMSAVSP